MANSYEFLKLSSTHKFIQMIFMTDGKKFDLCMTAINQVTPERYRKFESTV